VDDGYLLIVNRWTIRSHSALTSRQVSVLGLYLYMKLDGIVRGKIEGDYSV